MSVPHCLVDRLIRAAPPPFWDGRDGSSWCGKGPTQADFCPKSAAVAKPAMAGQGLEGAMRP